MVAYNYKKVIDNKGTYTHLFKITHNCKKGIDDIGTYAHFFKITHNCLHPPSSLYHGRLQLQERH
eukprot:1151501-Pelagomonas_calceolata.AAC.1